MQNPRSTRAREEKARVLLSLGEQCIQQARIELDAAEDFVGITADVHPTSQQRHERLRDQDDRLARAHERHCALLEALGRLLGLHHLDGVIPVAELQAAVDRDLGRAEGGDVR
jgi:hypothetical protein